MQEAKQSNWLMRGIIFTHAAINLLAGVYLYQIWFRSDTAFGNLDRLVFIFWLASGILFYVIERKIIRYPWNKLKKITVLFNAFIWIPLIIAASEIAGMLTLPENVGNLFITFSFCLLLIISPTINLITVVFYPQRTVRE